MINLTNRPLVETKWLAEHLHEPDLCIVDSRCYGHGNCRDIYLSHHIPGAIHLCWHADLSFTNKQNLRYMALPPERFSSLMSKNGIGADTKVVAYAETDHSGAARLWWLLRYFGHEQVSVLNGGLTKWIAEKRPISRQMVEQEPTEFQAKPQSSWIVNAEQIKSIIEEKPANIVLIDSRPPEQYAGLAVWTPQGSLYLPPSMDWIDINGRKMRGGRIPGAINQHAIQNLDPARNWTYREQDEVRLRAEVSGIHLNDRIIGYCGCGVSASLGIFSLYVAQFRNVALYEASWEEWGTDPSFPINRDPIEN